MGRGGIEAANITCKQVAFHTLTHSCLILFVIVYTIVGGYTFKALEGPNEIKAHKAAVKERELLRISFVHKVKNITRQYLNDNENDWYWHMLRLATNYEKRVDAFIDPDLEPEWTTYGSLFFAGVVISTIGYGNIAPVTTGGRAFCMVYAVFGIALLLLVLASLGTLLARGATLAYRAMHLSVMVAKGQEVKPKRSSRRRRSSSAMVLRDDPESNHVPERQTSAEERREKVISDIWNSKPPTEEGKDGQDGLPMHVVSLKDEEEIKRQKSLKEEAEAEEEEEEENEDDIQIPVLGVLLFAFGYICAVAGMLKVWESEWSYYDAFYFSFITLTTIGFGDLVPQHQKNLLSMTFFILLGMAIMSMCIALAQDAIMKKVAWASTKIGVAIIKSKPTGK